MKFKPRNLRALAEMVVGDVDYFPYRSSGYITEFFEDCDMEEFSHDGSTRWRWAADRLVDLLEEVQPIANALPSRFVHLLRTLMDKAEAEGNDPDRNFALEALNQPLKREGYEAFYDENRVLYIRHVGTRTLSEITSTHRPLTPNEVKKRENLDSYLNKCSEDELIEEILLPLFRQLGYHRITAVGHKDKSLEYGKDMWMKYTLPTGHVLYFGIQVKKGKLDSAGVTKKSNANVAEVHNQVVMMLGHEIFDSETSKRVLVDHAFIIAGGEITKQARNWLGGKLDATKRSQILFMDRDDILNLYTVNELPLPEKALSTVSADFGAEEIPF